MELIIKYNKLKNSSHVSIYKLINYELSYLLFFNLLYFHSIRMINLIFLQSSKK